MKNIRKKIIQKGFSPLSWQVDLIPCPSPVEKGEVFRASFKDIKTLNNY